MTVVNPKSISGITSITTASGSDNLLTIHTSDANNTERFRIDSTGSVKVGSGITLSPDGDGFLTGITTIGTLSVSGIATVGGVIDSSTGTITASGDMTAGGSLTVNGGGGLTLSTGNVTIPDSIIHNGDTNTKIRFPAADTFTVTTGGSEAIRIDSSQRLVLGTNTARTVGGAVARKLQVEGSDGSAGISIVRNQNSASPPALSFGKQRSGSSGGNTIVQDDDNLGVIQFAGADGTDANTSAASISGQVDGTPGSNDMPGRLVFSTTSDGVSTTTERLRIDSQGRVGIGGSSTSAKLEVRDNAALGVLIRCTNTQTTDANKAIRVRNNSDTDTFYVSHKGKVYAADNILMASGKGIDFSATSDAGGTGASAGSELFDDYEEGTWVPTATEGTISAVNAVYTKIGRMVYVTARLESFSDRSSSNAIAIEGLPFTSSQGNNMGSGVFYRLAHTDEGHVGTVVTSHPRIQFLISSQGGSEAWFYLTYSDLNSSGSQIRLSVWYLSGQ